MDAEPHRDRMEILVSAVMTVIFSVSIAVSAGYPRPTCVMPLLVGIPGLVLSAHRLWSSLRMRAVAADAVHTIPDIKAVVWLLAFGAASLLFGFLLAGPAMVAAYVRIRGRMGAVTTAAAALAALLVLSVGFETLLGFPLFDGLVWRAWS